MGPIQHPLPSGSPTSSSSSASMPTQPDGLLPVIQNPSSSASSGGDRPIQVAGATAATTAATAAAAARAGSKAATTTTTATATKAAPAAPRRGKAASARGPKSGSKTPPSSHRPKTPAPLTASQKLADILTQLGKPSGKETALSAETKNLYKRFIDGYSAVGHHPPTSSARPSDHSAARRSLGIGPDASEIFSELFAEATRQEAELAKAAEAAKKNAESLLPSPLSRLAMMEEEEEFMRLRRSRQKAKTPRPETHYDYFADLGFASGAESPEEFSYRLKSQKKRYWESRVTPQGPSPPPNAPNPTPATPATARRTREPLLVSMSPASPTPANRRSARPSVPLGLVGSNNNNNQTRQSVHGNNNNSNSNGNNNYGGSSHGGPETTKKSPTRATIRDGSQKASPKTVGKSYDRFEIATALAKEKADQRMWEACESIRFLVFGTEAKAALTKDTRTAYERPRGSREEVIQLQRVWSQMDEDNSGDVEFQEFLSYFSRSKTDRLLGMRCVSYLVDKAQGEGSGEREVGCTIEDMMRLIWLRATDEDVAVMMHWFREAEFMQDRVPTPPLLPEKRYLAIMENFPSVDFENNETVSLQELVENSLVDSATVRGLYNQWSGQAPIATQTLRQQDFLEMLCPQGYRAHEGVKCCVDRHGQLLSFLENEFFVGWLHADKAETARVRLG